MSTSFIQEKHIDILDEVIVSKGKLDIIQPGKIAWRYIEPTEYSIIITPENTVIKNEKGVQSYNTQSNSMFKYINEIVQATFSGEIINRSDFEKRVSEEGTNYKVALTAKDNELSKYLEGVVIFFDKETLTMKKVSMLEPGGDFTDIIFKNLRTNIKIDETVFSPN